MRPGCDPFGVPHRRGEAAFWLRHTPTDTREVENGLSALAGRLEDLGHPLPPVGAALGVEHQVAPPVRGRLGRFRSELHRRIPLVELGPPDGHRRPGKEFEPGELDRAVVKQGEVLRYRRRYPYQNRTLRHQPLARFAVASPLNVRARIVAFPGEFVVWTRSYGRDVLWQSLCDFNLADHFVAYVSGSSGARSVGGGTLGRRHT